MFFFGLFSSQVPYIVFIAISLVYFITCLGNKQDNKEIQVSVQNKEIQYTSPYANNSTITNYLLVYQKDVASDLEEEKALPDGVCIILRLFYYSENFKPCFIGYALFSRPPPLESPA